MELDAQRMRLALQRAPAGLNHVLGGVVDGAAQMVAAVAKAEAPKGLNSQLVNSIQIERAGELERLVRPNTEYAQYVHDGRKPGKLPDMRPGSDFMEYVRLRVRPDGKKRDLRSNRQYRGYLDDAWGIAFAIKARGIAPNPFMARTYVATAIPVQAYLRAHTEAGLRELFA
ncbi:hypothetical protein IGB42_02636 [Andreprevotia sp. IGB-42]|nr:hypothetical protein IGB42_02636 [Andreprevotia sp. IGB-42]